MGIVGNNRAVRAMHDFKPSPQEAGWSLDQRLADDSVALGDLLLSRVLVSKDANYPWLLLVPRRVDVRDLIDLDEADRGQLLTEITQAAGVLKQVTRCDKLNIAALGNVVPQLHVHIIARRHDDAAWPRPVWGVAPPRAYADADLARFAAMVRRGLGIG